MITIELTKEQLSDVIRGIDFITKESERELSNMQFYCENPPEGSAA